MASDSKNLGIVTVWMILLVLLTIIPLAATIVWALIKML